MVSCVPDYEANLKLLCNAMNSLLLCNAMNSLLL